MIASAWILFGLIGAIVAKLLISERDLGFYADSLLVGSKRDDRWPCRAAIGFLFPGECDGVVLAIVGSIALLLLNYRISLEGRRRARIGRARKYSFPAMEKYEEIKAMVLESIEEHWQLKMLLRELAKLSPSSERFKPRLKVLMDDVEHHAEEEEEGKMFYKIIRIVDNTELDDLAEEIERVKHKRFRKAS